MTVQRWTWSRAGWVPVGTHPVSLPSSSEPVATETEKPAGWFRRLRRRREILGLTVAEAALLTGISPRHQGRRPAQRQRSPGERRCGGRDRTQASPATSSVSAMSKSGIGRHLPSVHTLTVKTTCGRRQRGTFRQEDETISSAVSCVVADGRART